MRLRAATAFPDSAPRTRILSRRQVSIGTALSASCNQSLKKALLARSLTRCGRCASPRNIVRLLGVLRRLRMVLTLRNLGEVGDVRRAAALSFQRLRRSRRKPVMRSRIERRRRRAVRHASRIERRQPFLDDNPAWRAPGLASGRAARFFAGMPYIRGMPCVRSCILRPHPVMSELLGQSLLHLVRYGPAALAWRNERRFRSPVRLA